jgi:ribose/xylose/arabinose/galactoside ABC-type transport system permease subunit
MTTRDIGKKAIATLVVPGFVYCIFWILCPNVFNSISTAIMLFEQTIAGILLAWGMNFSMTLGNLDFSAGAEMTLGSLAACMLAQKWGVPGMVAGVLLVAITVGLIKVVFMTFVDVKSMVISIAYTFILGALGYLMVKGKSMVIMPEQTFLGEPPYSVILFALCGCVMYYLQRYSVFGANCRALGGNEELSANAGICKKSIHAIAIMICSLYAAAAALISLSRGAGTTTQTGLTSLSIVFGSMSGVYVAFVLERYINITIGIIVGVYTMNIITIGLIALNIPSSMKDTVNGFFLLTLMLLADYRNRKEAERHREIALVSGPLNEAEEPCP